jgi:hypothetical protein
VRALANIIIQNLNLSDELPRNTSLLDSLYFLESEDGDTFSQILCQIVLWNRLELDFAALWEYFVTYQVDLAPIDTILRMAGGTFLCQVILEASGSDIREIEPISKLCQEFNTRPKTRDQHKINRSIHRCFQEECIKLEARHLWKYGSTSRYLNNMFRYYINYFPLRYPES